MKKIVLSLGAALLIAGCSSTVNLERYSLLNNVTPLAFEKSPNIQVTMHGALSEPGLVLRISPVEIRSAKHHLWDMNPQEQFEIIFCQALLDANLKVTAPVKIHISRFDSDPNGNVTIAAALRAKLSNNEVFTKSITWKGQQNESGYAAMAKSLSEGSKAVATEYVQALKEALKQ